MDGGRGGPAPDAGQRTPVIIQTRRLSKHYVLGAEVIRALRATDLTVRQG